jgi:hypothetical protein
MSVDIIQLTLNLPAHNKIYLPASLNLVFMDMFLRVLCSHPRCLFLRVHASGYLHNNYKNLASQQVCIVMYRYI